jgi:hypothetical protein
VRDYSREFAARRKAAGLKAITLGKLRHSNISRIRAAAIAADVVCRLAWPHRADDSGGLWPCHRRPSDRRVGGVLGSRRTELGQTARYPTQPANQITRPTNGRSGFLFVELRRLEPLTPHCQKQAEFVTRHDDAVSAL